MIIRQNFYPEYSLSVIFTGIINVNRTSRALVKLLGTVGFITFTMMEVVLCALGLIFVAFMMAKGGGGSAALSNSHKPKPTAKSAAKNPGKKAAAAKPKTKLHPIPGSSKKRREFKVKDVLGMRHRSVVQTNGERKTVIEYELTWIGYKGSSWEPAENVNQDTINEAHSLEGHAVSLTDRTKREFWCTIPQESLDLHFQVQTSTMFAALQK